MIFFFLIRGKIHVYKSDIYMPIYFFNYDVLNILYLAMYIYNTLPCEHVQQSM